MTEQDGQPVGDGPWTTEQARRLVAPDVLLRPLTGSRLHLSVCYHLESTSELVRATEDDLKTWQVCSWCQAELSGQGRHYYPDLERALEDYAPLPARPLVRDLANTITYDKVWAPNSRSYVALGTDAGIVASFGKTYWWQDGTLTPLPGYDSDHRAGATATQQREGVTCPTCYLVMPLTGNCPHCD